MKIKNFKINHKAAAKLATCVLVGTLATTTLTGCSANRDNALKGTILENSCVVTFKDGSKDIAIAVGDCGKEKDFDHYYSIISGEYFGSKNCTQAIIEGVVAHHYEIVKDENITKYLTSAEMQKSIQGNLDENDINNIINRVMDLIPEETNTIETSEVKEDNKTIPEEQLSETVPSISATEPSLAYNLILEALEVYNNDEVTNDEVQTLLQQLNPLTEEYSNTARSIISASLANEDYNIRYIEFGEEKSHNYTHDISIISKNSSTYTDVSLEVIDNTHESINLYGPQSYFNYTSYPDDKALNSYILSIENGQYDTNKYKELYVWYNPSQGIAICSDENNTNIEYVIPEYMEEVMVKQMLLDYKNNNISLDETIIDISNGITPTTQHTLKKTR